MRAFLSVYDKTGVVDLAQGLALHADIGGQTPRRLPEVVRLVRRPVERHAAAADLRKLPSGGKRGHQLSAHLRPRPIGGSEDLIDPVEAVELLGALRQ